MQRMVLSAYARGTGCATLPTVWCYAAAIGRAYWARVCCYAMCGTDLGYGATRRMWQQTIGNSRVKYRPPYAAVRYTARLLRACYATAGTERGYAATRRAIDSISDCMKSTLLPSVHCPKSFFSFFLANIAFCSPSPNHPMQAPKFPVQIVPRRRVISGSAENSPFLSGGVRYWHRRCRIVLRVAKRCPVLRQAMLLSGGASSIRAAQEQVQIAIVLRACYAVSGTGIAHGAVYLHYSSAMRGTDLAYHPMRYLIPNTRIMLCLAS
eukprot:3940563-Rhodomonas_salina.7